MLRFKIGCRVTDGNDSGEVVEQNINKNNPNPPKRTLVVWDREYKGCKQTGYPLTAELKEL